MKRLRYISLRSLLLFFILALATLNLTIAGRGAAYKELSATSVLNSAHFYSLNDALENLPNPEIIRPGQTSGHARGVISKLESHMTQLKNARVPDLELRERIFKPGLTREYKKYRVQSNELLETYGTDLSAWYERMKAVQQFMEYDPVVDLAIVAPRTQVEPERIERTLSGMNDTIRSLKKTGSRDAAESAEIIQSLIDDHSGSLKAGNVVTWSEAVAASQKDFITATGKDWRLFKQTYSNKAKVQAAAWAHLSDK